MFRLFALEWNNEIRKQYPVMIVIGVIAYFYVYHFVQYRMYHTDDLDNLMCNSGCTVSGFVFGFERKRLQRANFFHGRISESGHGHTFAIIGMCRAVILFKCNRCRFFSNLAVCGNAFEDSL